MFFSLRGSLVILLTVFAFSTSVSAQQSGYDVLPVAPTAAKHYRLETRQVVKQVPVTTYKEVVKTEMRTRSYVVKVPVRETSTREESHTVLKPVTETKYREEIVDRTVWETTTETQQQRYTTYKPVTETTYREETSVVQKPVTSTTMVNESVTTYKPVTTYQQQMVDRGGVQNQLVYRPGSTRKRINWVDSGYVADPVSGQLTYQRGGLKWISQQAPGVYQVQSQYVPNLQSQTIPTTTLQPQTQIVQRPVTRTEMVNETVSRRIPITTQKMVPEVHVQNIPVTVQKPVVKREIRRIPFTETRYVEQTVVKKVPIETVTYKYETRTEQYPVKVSEWVKMTEMVETTELVSQWVPIEETRIDNQPSRLMKKVPFTSHSADKTSTQAGEESQPKTSDLTQPKTEADQKPALTDNEVEKAKKVLENQ